MHTGRLGYQPAQRQNTTGVEACDFPRASLTGVLMATCLAILPATPALPRPQRLPQPAAPGAPAAPAAASGTATAPAAAPAAAAAPPPGSLDRRHPSVGAQIEGGFTINPANPDDGVNYGRLFDDRANQPQLNQVLLTANKPT